MNLTYYAASSRGSADYGWLQARYSFSFAGYYDPSRVHFGMLRVLNDDIIGPGGGFGIHPHDNMEIVTIPLRGGLAHSDSMGNSSVIEAGEIQIMSAGSGIQHAEFNASREEEAGILQIWIFPREQNVTPRYGQLSYQDALVKNQLKTLISPIESPDSLWLHQDAWISLGEAEKDIHLDYKLHQQGHGLFLFLIEGKVMIENQLLNARDALGIQDTQQFVIRVVEDARMLTIEVPMR